MNDTMSYMSASTSATAFSSASSLSAVIVIPLCEQQVQDSRQ